jgi:hypothetical protein
MQWLGDTKPGLPTNLEFKNGKLSWKAATSGIRSWTLYKQNGTTWKLVRILGGTTTSVAVEPGTYALCAVDNLANESAGVVVAVK